MRNLITIVESAHAGFLSEGTSPLSRFLNPTPAFLAAVRKAINSGWRDRYADDAVLTKAIGAIEDRIRVVGMVDSNEITVWRAELRPTEQVESHNFESVGIYWTFDEYSAEPVWPHGAEDFHGIDPDDAEKVVFETTVPLQQVDWAVSVAYQLVHTGEHEIRIPAGEVHIERIYVDDAEVPCDITLPIYGFED